MLRKIINKLNEKIRNIVLIHHINKKYNCDISLKTKIDKTSHFEGRNIVNGKTLINQSEVGLATYVSSSCIFYKTKIGRYCSIAPNVKVIAGNHPTSKYVSIHPIFYTKRKFAGLFYEHANTFKEFSYTDENEKFLCEIGNDVWIGQNVTIINGVKIGDGAIIAAGAVVSSDIPAYAIVGGIPAKIIRFRFSEEEINYLLSIKWWNKSENWIKTNAKYFAELSVLKERLKKNDL